LQKVKQNINNHDTFIPLKRHLLTFGILLRGSVPSL